MKSAIVWIRTKKSTGSLPNDVSSELAESSQIKETLEMEIGICKGFWNWICTFIGSAKDNEQDIVTTFKEKFPQYLLLVLN